jgi:hypothetical protein
MKINKSYLIVKVRREGEGGANPGGQVDRGHIRSSDENKGVWGCQESNPGPRIHAIQV